jgi:hypothetical protein
MRRALWLTLVGALLAGCQAGDALNADTEAPTAPKVASVGEPATSKARVTKDTNEIGLVVRRSGPPITVWSSGDAAFRMFRDKNQVGFEYDDLPPKFEPPHYSAKTWEEDHIHMGFGEILYDDLLVAAVYQEDHANQDRVLELVRDHQDQVGDLKDTPILGKHVSYWFWEKDNRRLMICAYETGHDVLKITVAMGDRVVMDALDMSIDKARKDQIQVDMSFLKQSLSPAPSIKS